MKLEQLELIEVTYTEDKQKAVLTFLDEDRGEIREVNFNKDSWDSEKAKYVEDPEKAEKVEEWSQEYFGLSFDELSRAVGEKKDVYAYDNFNSLWEAQIIEKFDEDMLGQIIQAPCTEVVDDGTAIRIRFEYEDTLYESRMGYADYHEPRKAWFVNPQKQKRQYEKFEKKFGIHVDNKEELVGKTLMIEVKKAMGKWIYSEIKAFPKTKK